MQRLGSQAATRRSLAAVTATGCRILPVRAPARALRSGGRPRAQCAQRSNVQVPNGQRRDINGWEVLDAMGNVAASVAAT